MCGLSGFISFGNLGKDNADKALELSNMTSYRGPDNQGHYKDSRCILLHNRLSIIDLSVSSNQPMFYENKVLLFNGEIFNYLELRDQLVRELNVTFKTDSDTEVLLVGLVHYNKEFLKRCNGMFAYVLYDKENVSFQFGRDRYGIKPLYYVFRDNGVYFCSEQKPLASVLNLGLNSWQVENFLDKVSYSDNFETFFYNVISLPPGSVADIDGDCSVQTWYESVDAINNEWNLDELESLIIDSLKLRLRSDVPVALTLSGGVDSSLLYILIKEHFPKQAIRIYTAGHKNEHINELDKVEYLTSFYGDSPLVVGTPTELSADFLLREVAQLDIPVWNFSFLMYNAIYSQIKKDGASVVIEGHGPDEMLGGYPEFMTIAISEDISRLKIFEAFKKLRIFGQIESQFLAGKSGYKFLKTIVYNLFFRVSFRGRRDVFFKEKTLPFVLSVFDRCSMYNSVESRMPYMDYRIVEYMLSIPTKNLISEYGMKAPLREIIKKYGHERIFMDSLKLGYGVDQINLLAEDAKKIVGQVDLGPNWNASFSSRARKFIVNHFFNDKN